MTQSRVKSPGRLMVEGRRLLRWLIVALAVVLLVRCRASTPAGIDISPITSVVVSAGPDFFDRVRRELVLDGIPPPVAREGQDGLVIDMPNRKPDTWRRLNLHREDTPARAQQVYASYRKLFTDPKGDWVLHLESGSAPEQHFISYRGARWNTTHGIPLWRDTQPDILIGVLRHDVFIAIHYSLERGQRDYVREVNSDIRYAADLLARASR
jgi:hypothetical protein